MYINSSGGLISVCYATVLIATAIPDIGPLVSLVGSIGFSVLGLLVPIIMETVWYWYPKEDGGDDDDDDEDNDNGQVRANGTKKQRTIGTTKSNKRWRRVRRIVRQVKNAFVLMFALFTLIGGTFFNVRDIVDRAFGVV